MVLKIVCVNSEVTHNQSEFLKIKEKIVKLKKVFLTLPNDKKIK